MELPTWFRDLPTWATVLSVLLGALVVMTGLSMVLGVVFAGIALGVELGSIALGVVVALFGLAILLVPAVVAFMVLSSDDEDNEDDESTEKADPIETLQQRYANGEIDEETFEARLDALLEEQDEDGPRRTDRNPRAEAGGDTHSSEDPRPDDVLLDEG
ncbi:SHOCT domain-containing protein [Halostagnicola sp. A-GB9-2]|uniref:SHOCT domain-containing protein n=1 Tax=Halostagnicola sp. A-GB9-2 TaxID=3048066 RepID=UPI0024BF8F26|nr:SHOCT domain-containing protein [Halostagnicola sp. A-GB9-2]MDJ1430982.1 SHOCT domain-containing protein [Halostagnicola sp. A-GB9-2]